jgi:hypothetical protein
MEKIMKTKLLPACLSALFSIVFVLLHASAWAQKSPYDWALIQLDYIRQEKVDHLKRFTRRMHDLARKASDDQRMIAFFEMNRHYHQASINDKPTASLTDKVEEMRQDFNQYYIFNYFSFYDILFVDTQGTVFYSIRKEKDTYLNLVNEKEVAGDLGEVIAQKPEQEVFVDFYHYSPSSEPAAFFIEPIIHNGVQEGWIVLQCAINRLNSIFSSTDDLGQTGETFLVNQTGFMLTESYFKGDSTILTQELDDKNIRAKFTDRIGHRVVTDYRGATALTSFEVFDFLGTKWLVVAKIDKDEITTNHYLRQKKYYSDLLLEYLKISSLFLTAAPAQKNHPAAFRVDMDEFLKAKNGELLETWGVTTCTALIATVPGRFCYLAHISPLDKVYNGSGTNIVEQITKKIKNFDIYPYEMQDVVFVAAAPHLDSISNIIDQLIEEGFFLSQIKMAYHPSAGSVAVYSDYQKNRVIFEWILQNDTDSKYISDMEQTVNMGDIIEEIMHQNKEG